MSDSGMRGSGFETLRRRVLSLSKTFNARKILVSHPGSGGSVSTLAKDSYPPDCRADNAPYRHDRRADKNPYRHDRNMGFSSKLNYALFSILMVSFL